MGAFSFDDLQRNPKERRDAIYADLEWAAKHSDFARGYRAGIEAAAKVADGVVAQAGNNTARSAKSYLRELPSAIRALPDVEEVGR